MKYIQNGKKRIVFKYENKLKMKKKLCNLYIYVIFWNSLCRNILLKINTNKDAAQWSGYGHYELVVFGSNPLVGKSKVD